MGNKFQKIYLLLPPGERLDRALFKALEEKELSRNQIQKLIREGHVKKASSYKPLEKPGLLLKEEMEVEVEIPIAPSSSLEPKEGDIPILYEDDHLAIIHKPPGLLTHPGVHYEEKTLVHILLGKLSSLSFPEDNLRPGIVHRLDRDTEGIMVVAKTNIAHNRLLSLFKRREIKKKYYAWILSRDISRFPLEKGKIHGYIGRSLRDRRKMDFALYPFHESCKEAVLFYSKKKEKKHYALLEIELFTGRTHQIRATFPAFGCAVVGDILYGKIFGWGKKMEEFYQKFGLLLLAYSLEFIHPFTGEKMEFHIEFPQRFRDFENSL